MARGAKKIAEPKLGFLQQGFLDEQRLLGAQLRSSNRIRHAGDRGEVNEQFYIDLLKAYLPCRYTVAKAAVLDSTGRTSDSIDVVIFDRQYTPTLFDNKKHRYVPAEAVYAVFECKPTIDKEYLEYAADKVASVRRLTRTSIAVHHAGGVYPAKPLFKIIGGILSIGVDWKDGFGKSFRGVHSKLKDDRSIECGFAADGASFDTFAGPNAYTFAPQDNALAFFIFRLLWKLQSLATVPAVDWIEYANRLSQPKAK